MGADVGNNPSTMPPIGAPPLTRAAADLRVVEGPIGRRSESGVFFCEFGRQISTEGLKKPLTTNFVDPADSRYSTLADINKEIFVQKTPAQQQRSQAVPYGPYCMSECFVCFFEMAIIVSFGFSECDARKAGTFGRVQILADIARGPDRFSAQAAPPTSALASPTISAKPTTPAKPTTSAKMITSTKPTTSAPSDSPSASGKSSTLAAPKDMASSMSAPIIAEATGRFHRYRKPLDERQLNRFIHIHRPFLVVYTEEYGGTAEGKFAGRRAKRDIRAKLITEYEHKRNNMCPQKSGQRPFLRQSPRILAQLATHNDIRNVNSNDISNINNNNTHNINSNNEKTNNEKAKQTSKLA
ncbi:hypothetical protein niasHS_009368 [Heterodera schachtii]|uniref:Uncharacterized protein n=1 Tax=Heterodera schachtii TaxID=97005 RepID=A0ABD2JBX6_HETSC